MTGEFSGFALLRSRYGAFMIDALLFLVLWFLGALLAGSIGMDFNRWNAIALAVAYFGLFPATPFQGTPGKRACGIKITDVRGNRLSVGRSLARFAASVPSLGAFGAGFLPAAWTRRRQALHDLIAGTLVVTLDAAAPAEAPRLSIFARIATCAGVGLSAYAVYLVVAMYHAVLARDAFGDMWQVFGEYRMLVSDALLAHRPMPPPARPGPLIKTLRAEPDGTIVIEPAAALVKGVTARIPPHVEGDSLTWTCTYSGDPDSFARGAFRTCDAAAAPAAASPRSSTSSP